MFLSTDQSVQVLQYFSPWTLHVLTWLLHCNLLLVVANPLKWQQYMNKWMKIKFSVFRRALFEQTFSVYWKQHAILCWHIISSVMIKMQLSVNTKYVLWILSLFFCLEVVLTLISTHIYPVILLINLIMRLWQRQHNESEASWSWDTCKHTNTH